MNISLILPCYNPPTDWDINLCDTYKALVARLGCDLEVIIVLDGVDTAKFFTSIRYIQSKLPNAILIDYTTNMGKGYAIRKGVETASGDIFIYTDIDFPYSVESMLQIIDSLKQQQCDVAVGIKDENYYKHVPMVRRQISKLLQGMIKVLLRIPTTDTQCGLKGFKSSVKPLFLSTSINRYLFDLEFIYSCYSSKQYIIKTYPVRLREHVKFRRMNYSILFSEGMNFLKLYFK